MKILYTLLALSISLFFSQVSANYGSCNSDGGTKYYQYGTRCIDANFYCNENKLLRGSQFSPRPPQPTVGIKLYDTKTLCDTKISGDNMDIYFKKPIPVTTPSNSIDTTNNNNNNNNNNNSTSEMNFSILLGDLENTLDGKNPYTKRIPSKYKPKLDSFVSKIQRKKILLGEVKYSELINKINDILSQAKSKSPNNTNLLNIIGYLAYELNNGGDEKDPAMKLLNLIEKTVSIPNGSSHIQKVSCGTSASDVDIVSGLDWANQGSTGGYTKMNNKRILSMPFTATSNPELNGNVSVAASVGNSDVLRKVWFSSCAGGPELSDRCMGKGTSTAVAWWEQKIGGRYCYLEPGQKYHINIQNIGVESNPDRCKLNTSCDMHLAFRKNSVAPYLNTNNQVGDIDLEKPGSLTLIKMGGNNIKSFSFYTGNNPEYSARMTITSTTGNSGVSRKTWLSKTPGGSLLPEKTVINGKQDYKCRVNTGTSTTHQNFFIKGTTSKSLKSFDCILEPKTLYYWNVENVNCKNANGCDVTRIIYSKGGKANLTNVSSNTVYKIPNNIESKDGFDIDAPGNLIRVSMPVGDKVKALPFKTKNYDVEIDFNMASTTGNSGQGRKIWLSEIPGDSYDNIISSCKKHWSAVSVFNAGTLNKKCSMKRNTQYYLHIQNLVGSNGCTSSKNCGDVYRQIAVRKI